MSVEIVYKDENEELFWKYWHQVVKNESWVYFPNNIKIYSIISRNIFKADKSFIYLVNKVPLAVVYLPIEKTGNNITISLNNSFIPSPIFNRSVEKKVFGLIDEIAREQNVGKIMFAVDPLSGVDYNYLQKYKYKDASILSHIINLEKSDLLSACRKGHRSEIKKILKDGSYFLFFIDEKNPDYEIFKNYVALHHLCSGKKTRPDESFDLQFNTLKGGNSALFGLRLGNKNIAFAYFEFNKKSAVYYSGADDPEFAALPLYHVLILSAMDYLKEHGITRLDVGQPSSPTPQYTYLPDSKQLNIALFKRGFGGDYIAYYRGIKYFSKDLFKHEMDIFTQNYLETINYV